MKYNYKLIIKKDTEANWGITNYIPLEGEPCYDTTRNIFKIGDGLRQFEDLPSVTGLKSYEVDLREQETIHTATTEGQNSFLIDENYLVQIAKVYVNGIMLTRNNEYVITTYQTESSVVFTAFDIYEGDKIIINYK